MTRMRQTVTLEYDSQVCAPFSKDAYGHSYHTTLDDRGARYAMRKVVEAQEPVVVPDDDLAAQILRLMLPAGPGARRESIVLWMDEGVNLLFFADGTMRTASKQYGGATIEEVVAKALEDLK